MSNSKIHQIQGYIQTIYLVEGHNGLLLLDSGCRCDVETVKNYIEQKLNRSFSDLKLVIVSHAHPDHSGGARLFQKKYNIKIAGHQNINLWYQGLFGLIKYLIDLLLTYMVAMRKSGKIKNIIFSRKQKLDYELEDMSVVPGFENWKTLFCPGHTAVDLTLYNEQESLAYVADNLVGSRKNIFRPYPLTFPELYRSSLQKYLDLNIKKYLLAHYGEVEVARERIEFLIQTTPKRARVHKNTLPIIFKHLLRSILRKRK